MTMGKDKSAGGRGAAGDDSRRYVARRPPAASRGASRAPDLVRDLSGRVEPALVGPKPPRAVHAIPRDDTSRARPSRIKAPDLDAARRRLAALPTGFTDPTGSMPAWPADVPEIIGPRAAGTE